MNLEARVAAIVGKDHVTGSPARLAPYGRDAWPRLFLVAREARVPRPPDLVCWPGSADEVSALVRLSRETGVPLIPYGAGSGVCGGTYPLFGGIAVDLKRLDGVGEVDPIDRLVTVGAGAMGQHLEDRLNRQGYTLGHFPSSIFTSTAGGWVAARSAGQASSRYGKIEDLVSGLVFVDGEGGVHTLEPRPRVGGPDTAQIVIGSEGVLAVVTEATLRVRRLPAVRRMRGVLMPSAEAGLRAMRAIFAAGHRPAVVRLYDPLDTLVNKGKGADTGGGGGAGAALLSGPRRLAGWIGSGAARVIPMRAVRREAAHLALARPSLANAAIDRIGGASLLVLGSEGQVEPLVSWEARRCLELCEADGGRDLGAGPGEHWLAHRYSVSYKLAPALDAGLFVDTMEVATTWDRVAGLYAAVRDAVRDRVFVMAHFSHAYEEGCSIYFTFSGWGADEAERTRRYDATWRAALEAVVEAGATFSHHHGVGMAKQAFMAREHPGGMGLMAALKTVLDPDGILNPGKLGLGGGPALPGADWQVEVAS